MCPPPPDHALEMVFFDLDGTLLENPEHFPEVFVRVLRDGGMTVDLDRVGVAVAEIWPEHAGQMADYAPDELAFWRSFNTKMCAALGAGPQADALGRQLTETFSALDRPTLFDDALPCLDVLQAAGLGLGVITARPDARRLLEPLGVAHRFALLVDAFGAGSAKQDPTIYRHALQKAGLAPATALHVGDQYERDVLPALAVGMHAVLLDRDGRHPDADVLRITSLAELPDLVARLG